MPRRHQLSASILAGALICAPLAVFATEPIVGQSQELGISVEVAGGKRDWCAPNVVVSMRGKTPSAFVRETLTFTQMIGRIRAAALDACPFIERMRFEASAPNGYASTFEMTRLTDWRRFVPFDTATKQPQCPSKIMTPLDCARSILAYEAAHEMLSGDDHREAILTTFLSEDGATHVVWREVQTVGKLSMVDRQDVEERYGGVAGLADALITEAARTCINGNPASADVSFTDSIDAAQRSMGCPEFGVTAKIALSAKCSDNSLCQVTVLTAR